MSQYPPPIAAIQGADGGVVQGLLRAFVGRWSGTVRIAGLIEEARGEDVPTRLRSIAGGDYYPLFQDLGAGSDACALDGESLVSAGEAVRHDIAAGCDLVILSKFGKLEAEDRSGLMAAFIAAIEAGVPVLTSVAPRHASHWSRFADPLAMLVPADMTAIEDWWLAHRAPATQQDQAVAIDALSITKR